MRFVGITGVLARAKRFLSLSASVQDDDVSNPGKTAEVMRSIMLRLSEVESRLPPDGIEFEVSLGTAGATVSLVHSLAGPVRWWVTEWTRPVNQGAYPTANPILVRDASSDSNKLVLRSYGTGRAIIRVESSSGVIEP